MKEERLHLKAGSRVKLSLYGVTRTEQGLTAEAYHLRSSLSRVRSLRCGSDRFEPPALQFTKNAEAVVFEAITVRRLND